MSKPGKIHTTVVDADADVVYATGPDVFTHVRNKSWYDLSDAADPNDVGNTSLTKEDVNDLISRFTDKVDGMTKRAWRRRRVEAHDVRIKFRHEDKRGRLRRRSRRGSGGVVTTSGRRGFGRLPHVHVFDIDAAKDDSVEVLNPRSRNDVTDNAGREDGVYVVDNRKGVIRPNVSLFVPSGRKRRGSRDIENARLRVSYRYGFDPAPETDAGVSVSTAVPGDVRDAVALYTASRLLSTDQYGELTPNGNDDVSVSDAASSFKDEADELIRDYRRP